jgi:hypothetical protein
MLRELRSANMSQPGREWLEGSVHGMEVVLEDQDVELAENSAKLATTMSGAGALAPHQKQVRRVLVGAGGDGAPALLPAAALWSTRCQGSGLQLRCSCVGMRSSDLRPSG